MRYLPHTGEDIAEMLEVVGVSDLEGLFETVPEACRRSDDLDVPDALTEMELREHLAGLAATMAAPPEYLIFAGAGSYDHFIPASVQYLLGRSEFSTAYTPYQPEMSQGTLQAIYEYQTLVATLLGLDAANASLYDGASSLAEALLMGIRITRRRTVAVSRAVHPSVPAGGRKPIFSLPGTGSWSSPTGKTEEPTSHHWRRWMIWPRLPCNPPISSDASNQLDIASEKAHERGALFVTGFSEPVAYGLLKSPGSQGADIACGEGRSFGMPESFGGPGWECLRARRSMSAICPADWWDRLQT